MPSKDFEEKAEELKDELEDDLVISEAVIKNQAESLKEKFKKSN